MAVTLTTLKEDGCKQLAVCGTADCRPRGRREVQRTRRNWIALVGGHGKRRNSKTELIFDAGTETRKR